MHGIKYMFLLLTGALAPVLSAQSAHQWLREGDRHYERGNYKDAEQAYRRAAEEKTGDPGVAYNTGNAVYKQGNYAEAEKLFDQSARQSKDPAQQADALHNLGNTFFKQQKYDAAIQAYENSLRLRPGDAATKVNLQMARKKRQEQAEQQKQNQQNPNQQNQNQQQNPSDQQQNQQPNPPQQPQDQPGSPPNQPQPQPEQQPSEGKMSPEQARRLLETAVAPEDQRNARKYREQEPGKHQVKPKKDW